MEKRNATTPFVFPINIKFETRAPGDHLFQLSYLTENAEAERKTGHPKIIVGRPAEVS